MQGSNHGRPQWWQIMPNGLPDNWQFDTVVLVPQPVPNTADISPGHAGDSLLGFGAEANCRFADDLQLALYRGNSFWIFTEGVKIHAMRETPDHLDRFGNIAQRFVRVLKR